jgi:hypothetical protein
MIEPLPPVVAGVEARRRPVAGHIGNDVLRFPGASMRIEGAAAGHRVYFCVRIVIFGSDLVGLQSDEPNSSIQTTYWS